MVSRKRHAIALLVDSVSSEYAALFHHAVQRAANARDVEVVTFTGMRLGATDLLEATQNRIYELVDPARVDGVIVVSSLIAHFCGAAGVATLCRRYASMPVCSVGLQVEGVPSVVVDNEGGMERGVAHLLDAHGRRRIALIAAQPNSSESNERISGYRNAHEKRHLPVDERLIYHADFTLKGGDEAVRRLFSSGIEFDAIAAANDYMALGAFEVVRAHGKKVPRDIPVLGFDDIANAICAQPSLSTLRQPMWWLATEAVRLVLGQLAGESVPLVSVGAVELVRRESCGCGFSMAEVEPVADSPPLQLHEVFAQQRETLEQTLLDTVLVPNKALGNWASQLLDALDMELAGSKGTFSGQLEALLERAADVGTNLDEFQRTITALRDEMCQHRLQDDTARHGVEQVWHAARLAIASSALRGVGRESNQIQEAVATLGRSGERFAAAMSLPLLKQALLEELPALQIEQGAISLYETDFGSPLVPFLMLKNRQEVLVEQTTLVPNELAPDAAFASETCSNSVVMPLTFEGHSLGVAVFDAKAIARVYGSLRQQIGSAIEVAVLHRRIIAQVEARERLEQIRISAEGQMAARIQTSMSPTQLAVQGLEIAGIMVPAAEAGGDYYDVLPDDNGAWLAIGDVAGHGLGAGLIMLMIQSVIAGLVRNNRDSLPSQLISVVNEVIYDNVRNRLHRDEHTTLTVIRYRRSGELSFAGAHEPIVVFRAKTGRCEVVETPGFWVGILPDVRAMMEDASFQLYDNDVMLLYTDGVTEARNAYREQFGLERLVAFLEGSGKRAVADIRDGVLSAVKAWSSTLDDDMTLLVVRYRAEDLLPEAAQVQS